MKLNQRQKFLLLFGFHLLWGLLLVWSIVRNGMGTSRDSAEYLFTSLSLVEGRGFVSYAGQPFVLWPPLYSILLAILQFIGAGDPYVAAHALHFLTFLVISYCICHLFLRIFAEDFWLAFAGNAIAAVGISMTILFQGIGADYLHLALVLMLALLAGDYIKSNRIQTVWWMTLICALAMLQRYLGLAALLTSLLIVIIHTRGPARERIKRSAWLGLSLLPVGVWILSISTSTLLRDPPQDFLRNVTEFTASILLWFFSPASLQEHPLRMEIGLWLIWLLIAACAVVLFLHRRRSGIQNETTLPILLYGFVYSVVLLGISGLSYFNRLEDRFISPVYIPFIILIMLAIKLALDRFEQLKFKGSGAIGRIGAAGLLLLIFALALQRSIGQMVHMFSIGEGYHAKAWNENDALRYLQDHPPQGDYVIFSNYPAGIALHTWLTVLPSPRRSPNPNVDEIYPLEGYKSEILQPGKASYLIWIEPNSFSHVYSVEELRLIAQIGILFENEDGGVYKLFPLR